jgi:hypothetical protein
MRMTTPELLDLIDIVTRRATSLHRPEETDLRAIESQVQRLVGETRSLELRRTQLELQVREWSRKLEAQQVIDAIVLDVEALVAEVAKDAVADTRIGDIVTRLAERLGLDTPADDVA